MSSPEDRLVALLERFRFPVPWAVLQVVREEYDQACADRNQLREMGKHMPEMCSGTFSTEGEGPTRLDLFERDAEDKWRRFQSLWQPVEELCHLLRERGLFGEMGVPPMSPNDPYTPVQRAEKVARILDRVQPFAGLTEEDVSILNILDGHSGAMTYARIISESVRRNAGNPKRARRLSDSLVRSRVAILLAAGHVARPPGTQKKGVTITEGGRKALKFAHGNTTETQRII